MRQLCLRSLSQILSNDIFLGVSQRFYSVKIRIVNSINPDGPGNNSQDIKMNIPPTVFKEGMQDSSSGYASVNGLIMYYEIHGKGAPLVLIHGGGSTIQTSFGRVTCTSVLHSTSSYS